MSPKTVGSRNKDHIGVVVKAKGVDHVSLIYSLTSMNNSNQKRGLRYSKDQKIMTWDTPPDISSFTPKVLLYRGENLP